MRSSPILVLCWAALAVAVSDDEISTAHSLDSFTSDDTWGDTPDDDTLDKSSDDTWMDEPLKDPPYDDKQVLNCEANYPSRHEVVPENPRWTALYNLENVPRIDPVVYDNGDICEQHRLKGERNAECGDFEDEPRQCTNRDQWALTFENGPSKYTKNVIKALDEAGEIKATFFVIGGNLCKHASEMIKAVNEGHEIGINTWSHRRLSTLTNGQIIAEIKWTEKAIMELTSIKPKYIRPPYGNMDDRVRFIIAQMGYIPVMWSADTDDWKHIEVNPNNAKSVQAARTSIVRKIASSADRTSVTPSPGTISLQHDRWAVPTMAVKAVVDHIKKKGWKFATMTTCLNPNSFAQNGPIIGGKPRREGWFSRVYRMLKSKIFHRS